MLAGSADKSVDRRHNGLQGRPPQRRTASWSCIRRDESRRILLGFVFCLDDAVCEDNKQITSAQHNSILLVAAGGHNAER
jgi:hypothetical protein